MLNKQPIVNWFPLIQYQLTIYGYRCSTYASFQISIDKRTSVRIKIQYSFELRQSINYDYN